MAYELLSESKNLNKRGRGGGGRNKGGGGGGGGVENFLKKKISWGTLIRDRKVFCYLSHLVLWCSKEAVIDTYN